MLQNITMKTNVVFLITGSS